MGVDVACVFVIISVFFFFFSCKTAYHSRYSLPFVAPLTSWVLTLLFSVVSLPFCVSIFFQTLFLHFKVAKRQEIRIIFTNSFFSFLRTAYLFSLSLFGGYVLPFFFKKIVQKKVHLLCGSHNVVSNLTNSLQLISP